MAKIPYGRHRRNPHGQGDYGGLSVLARLWALRALLPMYDRRAQVRRPNPNFVGWALGLPRATAFERIEQRVTQTTIRRAIARLVRDNPSPTGPVLEVVDRLGELAGLAALERQVLLFGVACSLTPLTGAFEERSFTERELAATIANVVGLDEPEVARALALDAPLRGGGLVKMDTQSGFSGITHWIEPAEIVLDACRAGVEPRLVIDHIVPRAPAATCTLDDFAHLADDVRLLRARLAPILAGGGGRMQVLVHGPPGVGKSELVRALVASLDAVLHEVRFEDREGSAMDSQERLLGYRLAQRLLGRMMRTVLVFEEIEDLFPVRSMFFGMRRETPDTKALTNRTLEQATVPTFFLSNEIEQIDPAVLRRFDYVLHVGIPPRGVRGRMLARHLDGLPVRAEWIAKLAERDDLTPSAIETAARFVRALAWTDASQVERALDHVVTRGMGGVPRKASRIEQRVMPYSLSSAGTDVPLEPLVEGLRREKRGTILFAGPPGTGKTEAAQEIARRLERPLVVRAASDLLSCWLGGTEKNLARAFDEALADGAVLLLDEIDSFLQSRERAVRTWETTQVNELLVQIERFDGILIATTNFASALDRAAMRRFAVKVTFSPPDASQKWSLFEAALRALELAVPAGDEAMALRTALASMPALAPGHFAAAVRSARLMRQITDAGALVTQLAAEHAHEPGARRRAGFA
jgi:SpoVK/Ycf46/Vps4 family AAA+-type ATPase